MATIEMSKMKVGSNVVEIVDQKARDGVTQLNTDKDELQYVKADVIKCTRTGENIEVTDSANAGFENLKIFGRSEQISTTGKNLVIFKVNNSSIFDAETGTFTSTTTTNTVNQSIKIQMYKDGTSVSYIGEGLGELKTYKLTFKKTNAFNRILVSFNGNMKDSNIIADISHLTDGTTYKIVFTLDSISTNKSSLSGLMIVDESVIDFTYEPYSGGVASPSPDWAQPIKSVGDDGSVNVGVYGKNLLPYPYNTSVSTNNGGTFTMQNDGGVSLSGTPTGHSSIIIYDGGKICDGKVLFCMLGIYENCKMSIMLYDNKSTFIFGNEVYIGEYLTVDMHDYANIGRIVVSLVRASNGATMSGTAYPMVVAGDKIPTKFEKGFAKQSLVISTSSGLPAIQVTDPTVATYTDSEGKMWVADEINFARGKYVQRIETVVLTGDETYELNQNELGIRFIRKGLRAGYELTGLINLFSHGSWCFNANETFNAKGKYSVYATGQLFINLNNSQTVSDFKAILVEEYSKGTPVTIQYVIATPIERDLTSAEIAAYKALHTNYPSTVIMNDSSARMEATYHADTFNYVNDHYGESVLYGEQRLSDEQKQQARINVDAANSIKKTYSGETIVSTESAHSWLEGLRVFGRSEQASTTGKNLFGGEVLSDKIVEIASGTKDVANGIIQWSPSNSSGKTLFDNFKENTRYTIILYGKNTNNDIDYVNIGFKYTDGTENLGTFGVKGDYVQKAFYTNGSKSLESLVFTWQSGGTILKYDKCGIFEGHIELEDFEPYTGGKPSPSPEYPQPIESVGDDGSIDVGVYGGNFFKPTLENTTLNGVNVTNNGNGTFTLNGSNPDSFVQFKLGDITLKKGTYKIIGNTVNNNELYLSGYAFQDKGYGVVLPLEKDVIDTSVFYYIPQNTTLNNVTIKPMFTKNLMATYDDFEPYKEPQFLVASTPNGLPSIPLGSTIPDSIKASKVHMDGVYWDEKTQQYHIADTVSGSGKYVQRIGKKVLDENAYITVSSKGYIIGGFGNAISVSSRLCPCMSNIRKWVSANAWTVGCFGIDYATFWFEDSGYVLFPSVDDFKSYLTNNPMVVYYILAESIERDLTKAEMESYRALHSNYPSTTILNDENAHMEVTLVADTKNHIEQNYVPLDSYKALEARVLAVEQALA